MKKLELLKSRLSCAQNFSSPEIMNLSEALSRRLKGGLVVNSACNTNNSCNKDLNPSNGCCTNNTCTTEGMHNNECTNPSCVNSGCGV